MHRAAGVILAVVATVGAAATFDAAAALQSGDAVSIVEERSTPDQVTLVVPLQVGAPRLDAHAFRLVVDGAEQPAIVTRPVDEGLDLVVLLDAGRLGGHLLPAKGAASELLLQLPASVRVLVWGASAIAPSPGLVPVPPADGVVAVGAVQPAPPGDLGATLRALAGSLDPARRHAAVVVTAAGEHTDTLPQAFDDYEVGIELVDVPSGTPPNEPEILAALDAYALELPGTYEVSTPATGNVEAVLVALESEVVRVDLPGVVASPTTAESPPTVGTQTTTGAETTVVAVRTVNTAPPVSPASLPPLSVELSTRIRPDEGTEMLGLVAIGVAVALSGVLVGLVFVRLRRARRAVPTGVDDGEDIAAPPTLADLYGMHADGTTAPACRLLCVVELAAASRLDGENPGLADIRGALEGCGGSDLRRWVDVLYNGLLLRSRRPLDDRLRAALERLDVRSDLVTTAARIANENGAADLHRSLYELGRPWRFGHRLAALGLALRDPFGTRPAPLAVTPFLSWGPDGPDDLPSAVVRATSWHETVKRRMRSRLFDRGAARENGWKEDPAQLVIGLLDRLVPTGASRP